MTANNSKLTYSELVKKTNQTITKSDGSYQFEFGASIAREYGIQFKHRQTLPFFPEQHDEKAYNWRKDV